MDWKNKVVVITGASSGIGLSLAEQFAAKGANLILAARSFVTTCEIATELKKKHSITAIAVACDVTKEEDCKAMIFQAVKSFGKIDVLINNAGLSMRSTFSDVNLDVIRYLMEVNFFGTAYCTKYALPHLLESKGSVVGVSSVAGIKGIPERSGYCASKFALNGLLDVLRVENLRKGLHVLVAMPGFTATNIRKVSLDNSGKPKGESHLDEKALMTADEVAMHIIKAIEKRKRTLVLTREGKLVQLLSKFAPAFLDKQVYKRFKKEKDSSL